METRLIVCGGTDFRDYEFFKAKMDELIVQYSNVQLVSGHARGADSFAERYAAENGCRSVAFPCISTGVYGYPIEDAANIAVREAEAFLQAHDMEIVFCCFSSRDKVVYEELLKK